MDTTTSPSQERKRSRTPLERLLINRNYAYNWIGLTFSQLGNVVFTVALILWVGTTLARNAPWAAFALGGLVFLPTVVLLVVNIFAGVYVDRWDARRTQLFMDAGRAVLFTLLIFATGVVPLPATAICWMEATPTTLTGTYYAVQDDQPSSAPACQLDSFTLDWQAHKVI